jgi:hypothetical protein
MFNFFKKKLGVDTKPVFRMKVAGFGNNRYYALYYSTNNGLTWNEIREAWTLALSLDIASSLRYMSLCYPSFENAVEKAKQFKTLEDVKAFEAAQEELIENARKKIEERIKSRERHWISE